jgi:hypothetical protein
MSLQCIPRDKCWPHRPLKEAQSIPARTGSSNRGWPRELTNSKPFDDDHHVLSSTSYQLPITDSYEDAFDAFQARTCLLTKPEHRLACASPVAQGQLNKGLTIYSR